MPIEEYNYNDIESGRGETLIKALDKIELLEKKLAIAISALKRYADEDNWEGPDEMHQEWFLDSKLDGGFGHAQTALKEIKDLG